MLCLVLVPIFVVLGIAFGIKKDKAAKYISGFNSLTYEEQEKYDKKAMAIDMRNSLFLWALVMLIGAILSEFVSKWFILITYAVWIALFLKDFRSDGKKPFEKYLLEKEDEDDTEDT